MTAAGPTSVHLRIEVLAVSAGEGIVLLCASHARPVVGQPLETAACRLRAVWRPARMALPADTLEGMRSHVEVQGDQLGLTPFLGGHFKSGQLWPLENRTTRANRLLARFVGNGARNLNR